MARKTYCNPVPFPDFPVAENGKKFGNLPNNFEHYGVSDPDGYFYDGRLYLFTSYGGFFSTEDMINWESHKVEGIAETHCGPAVLEKDNKFYYVVNQSPVYVADHPTGPYTCIGYFKDINGNEVKLDDPDFFMDDDGEVYLYYGCGGECGVSGVRLDKNDITQFTTEPKMLMKFNTEHEWERWGEYNQDKSVGWTEGACMIKIGSRYYLNYSGCGTTFGKYATGVYYSDTSPLDGFVYQNNNPVIAKSSGLVRGGGHSCVVANDKGEIWGFYTCPIAYAHRYERYIGMDRMYVVDGELHCKASDIPCSLDGKRREDLLPLTFYSITNASSCAPGRDSVYAADDTMLSFWQPAEDDENPELWITFRGDYIVGAYRIVRRILGLNYDEGKIAEPLKYKLCLKYQEEDWVTVVDRMDNDTFNMIEYDEIEPRRASEIKLIIKQPKAPLKDGIISLTAFGEKIMD